jgi:hypothetical protein
VAVAVHSPTACGEATGECPPHFCGLCTTGTEQLGVIRILVPAALAVALAACGSPGPQHVTVTMRADACDVQPAGLSGLSAGAASFAVLNETPRPVKFSITENSNEAVASVDVAPGATQHLDVQLDEADEYHVQCGDVRGPDVQPGG